MPSFTEIYAEHADRYDQLVAREDYQHNILRELRAIAPLEHACVVELGAGTGRLTRLLAPYVAQLFAFDRARHMLDVARGHLRRAMYQQCHLGLADNRSMPVHSAVVDMVIAGWSFGHATEWHAATWRAEITRAVGEMERVLRPGGTAIILETLGTGRTTPQPPNAALAAYYALLEDTHGFATTAIRTDYRFASAAEADQLTRFFFGAAMPHQLTAEGQAIVPECTGIWWRRTPAL